jgi:hypothetical protein
VEQKLDALHALFASGAANPIQAGPLTSSSASASIREIPEMSDIQRHALVLGCRTLVVSHSCVSPTVRGLRSAVAKVTDWTDGAPWPVLDALQANRVDTDSLVQFFANEKLVCIRNLPLCVCLPCFYVNALVAIAASICNEDPRRGSNCAERRSETGEAENFLKGNFIFTNSCVFYRRWRQTRAALETSVSFQEARLPQQLTMTIIWFLCIFDWPRW